MALAFMLLIMVACVYRTARGGEGGPWKSKTSGVVVVVAAESMFPFLVLVELLLSPRTRPSLWSSWSQRESWAFFVFHSLSLSP
jgi:hypothetical protein